MASEQFGFNGSTTLSQACGLNDLTVTVNNASASGLPQIPNFRIKIDSEEMLVTAVNLGTNVYTVTRAVEGTTQASHANGAPVVHNLTPAALTTAFARLDLGAGGNQTVQGSVTFSGRITDSSGLVLTQDSVTNVPISINGASNLPAQVNIKIQSGRFTASMNANSQTGVLTFPVAFAVGCNPVVNPVVEVGSNNDLNINLQSQPSNTSFTWRVFQNTGVAVNTSFAVHWTAIGF